MRKHAENEPIKMLFPSQLHIKGLQLLGHAKFQETFHTLKPHCHEGKEFIAILKGTQQYVIDEERYTLQGGDVFMTFPEELHGNGGAPQDVAEIVWFQLDCSDAEQFLGMSEPFSDYLFQCISSYKNRITHVNQKDLNHLREAFCLLNSSEYQKHLLGHNYFLEFLIHNFCKGEVAPEHMDAIEFSGSIAGAVEYIHSHLLEHLSLEHIAEECGLSYSNFHTRFKEQIGSTPHAYIMKCKIELAKMMLKETEATVTDVAFQLNFSSSDYFSSVFKKYTGCTPTAYRQS